MTEQRTNTLRWLVRSLVVLTALRVLGITKSTLYSKLRSYGVGG